MLQLIIVSLSLLSPRWDAKMFGIIISFRPCNSHMKKALSLHGAADKTEAPAGKQGGQHRAPWKELTLNSGMVPASTTRPYSDWPVPVLQMFPGSTLIKAVSNIPLATFPLEVQQNSLLILIQYCTAFSQLPALCSNSFNLREMTPVPPVWDFSQIASLGLREQEASSPWFFVYF